MLTVSGAEAPMVVEALEELGNRSAALEETKNAVTPVLLRAEKMEVVGDRSAGL